MGHIAGAIGASIDSASMLSSILSAASVEAEFTRSENALNFSSSGGEVWSGLIKGRRVLTWFDGTIFNRVNLCAELNLDSDTSNGELLSQVFVQHKERIFDHVAGLFSLVLFDGATTHLVVDPSWCGCLYWTPGNDGTVLFSSRIRAFSKLIPLIPRIDQDLWSFEFPIGDHTMLQNVFRVHAGRVMSIDSCGHTKLSDAHKTQKSFGTDLSNEELTLKLLNLIVEGCAVVPSGTPMLLSGGLDSSVLAMLLRPTQGFVNTFSDYGPAYDEDKYADTIYDACGATKFVVHPTAEDFKELFPLIIANAETIFATMSPISDFILAREVARAGHTTYVAGHGPDELLNGYIRHVMMMFGAFHGGTDVASKFFEYMDTPSYRPTAEILWGSSDPSLQSVAAQAFRITNRSPLSCTEQLDAVTTTYNSVKGIGAGLSAIEWNFNYPSQAHMCVANSSFFGITPHCPFLNPRLVELCMSLPDQYRIRDGKYKWILRQVAKKVGVPESIIERIDKKGLVVPAIRWLNGPLREWANELITSLKRRLPDDPHVSLAAGTSEFDRSRYKLVSMELWFRSFID